MFLDCWQESGGCCTCNHLTWEVSNDRFEIDGFLRVSLVHFIDLNEKLFAGIMANALEQPVNCGFKQTEILVLGKFGASFLDGLIVMLVHEFNHDHEVFFLVGVDRVANSS